MNGWWRAGRKSAADDLHNAVVARSRIPALYLQAAIPDTAEGRFESLVLHLALVCRRLHAEGEEGHILAQALVDRAFARLDDALREMGTGDLSVPKKIKAMAANYLGRAKAYEEALIQRDSALTAALGRNVYGGGAAPGAVRTLAGYVVELADALDAITIAELRAGRLPSVHPGEVSHG